MDRRDLAVRLRRLLNTDNRSCESLYPANDEAGSKCAWLCALRNKEALGDSAEC